MPEPTTYDDAQVWFKLMFGNRGTRALKAFNKDNEWRFGDVLGDINVDWKDGVHNVTVHIEEDISPIEAAALMLPALEETRVYWTDDLDNFDVNDWLKFKNAFVKEAVNLASTASSLQLGLISIVNEGADWVLTFDELSQGNIEAVMAFLPFISTGMLKVIDKSGALRTFRKGQRGWDDGAAIIPAPKISLTDNGKDIWVTSDFSTGGGAHLQVGPRGPLLHSINAQDLPRGSGTRLLVAGLNAAEFRRGQTLTMVCVTNEQTLEVFRKGGKAEDTILGGMGAKALRLLGYEPSSFEWKQVGGAINIEIVVE